MKITVLLYLNTSEGKTAMSEDVLDFLFMKNDAVVVESFGMGGVYEAGRFLTVSKSGRSVAD